MIIRNKRKFFSITIFIFAITLIANSMLEKKLPVGENSDSLSLNVSSLTFLIGVILLFFVGTITLSPQKYRSLIFRTINPNYGKHRLTLAEIFENKNRKIIIELILETPGIHFNEIRRRNDMNPGQLTWHLNILVNYGIIMMKKVGIYNCFFPTISENIITDSSLELIKSKSTLKIFKLIKENPGITAGKIAKNLNLGRNTVKYHVDKLNEMKLIYFEREPRNIRIFFLEQSPSK